LVLTKGIQVISNSMIRLKVLVSNLTLAKWICQGLDAMRWG
jgi:hypothetical protein